MKYLLIFLILFSSLLGKSQVPFTTYVKYDSSHFSGEIVPFPDSIWNFHNPVRGVDTTRALLMLIDTSSLNYWMDKNESIIITERFKQFPSYIICAYGFVIREYYECYMMGVGEYERPRTIRVHYNPKDFLGVNRDARISGSSMVVVTYKILE